MIKNYIPQNITKNELKKYICYKNGLLIKYASDEIYNDIDFIITLLKICQRAYLFLPQHVKNNKEIISFISTTHWRECLECTDENILHDRDFLLTILKNKRNDFISKEYMPHIYKNFFNDEEFMLEILQSNPTLIQHSELRYNSEFILKAIVLLYEDEQTLLFENLPHELINSKTFLLQCLNVSSTIAISLSVENFYDSDIFSKVKTLVENDTLSIFDLVHGLEKRQDRNELAQLFVHFLDIQFLENLETPYEMRFHPLLEPYYPNLRKPIVDIFQQNEHYFYQHQDTITQHWFDIIKKKYEKELPEEDKRFLIHLMNDFEEHKENSIFCEYLKGEHFYNDLDKVQSIIHALYSEELDEENIEKVMHNSTESSFIAILEESDFILWENNQFVLRRSDFSEIDCASHLCDLVISYFERAEINHPKKIARYLNFCKNLGIDLNKKENEFSYYYEDNRNEIYVPQENCIKMNQYLFSLLPFKTLSIEDIAHYLPTLCDIEKYYLNDNNNVYFEYCNRVFMLQYNKYVFEFTDEGLKAIVIHLYNLPIKIEQKIIAEIKALAEQHGFYFDTRTNIDPSGDSGELSKFWNGNVFSMKSIF